MTPKISVVMPVYNGEKYLPETIESVLNQTFDDFEFIIVNELGSSAEATAILREYEGKDSRIRVIQNTERLGLALSLNAGIDAATGEYIARVDGDDPSYPERFEKQAAYLDANPDVFLCGTLQRSLLPTGIDYNEYPTNPEELRATLLFSCDISHCSVTMRRKQILDNGWRYTNNFYNEDFDLWTRIMREAKFTNLPEILVDHRWGFGQKSAVAVDVTGCVIDSLELRKSGQQISAHALEAFGVNIRSYDYDYVLGGFRTLPRDLGKANPDFLLAENFGLLCEIENINYEKRFFDPDILHNVLARRWVKWVLPCVGDAGKNYPDQRFTDYQDIAQNRARNIPAFMISPVADYTVFNVAPADNSAPAPLISVVMTVHNGAKHIREAIDSIIAQTCPDWEFLIINEYGSNDGTARIAKEYADQDSRVKLIQNSQKLGFAESLNCGIRLARGKYIARMDADDISVSTRLEIESKFLEEHPEIGHVGSWQKHFGRNNWVHKPLATHDEMKAALLFRCDVCHSTVMFRRDVFVNNNLFYDPNILAEDFELWTRAICVTRFATIPQILGKYRTGYESQTDQKFAALITESGVISAKAIERVMGLRIDESDYDALEGWKPQIFESEKRERFKKILLRIWDANKGSGRVDEDALLSQLYAFWRWAAYGESWKDRYKVESIDALINDNGDNNGGAARQRTERRSVKAVAKVVFKKLLRPFLGYVDRSFERLTGKIDETRDALYWDIDRKIWETEKIIVNNTNWNRGWITDRTSELRKLITTLNINTSYIPCQSDEKVRIVFLYEIPSLWPSWDTLLEALKGNPEVELKIMLFDIPMTEPEQIRGAEDWLIEKGVEYVRYDELDLGEYKPHIVVYQTPYDEFHHPVYLSAPILRGKGCRIVYIPYGIEITKTRQSEIDHFERQVVQIAWRVYTFSPAMRKDYLKHISPSAVKALGHPKFDRLYDKSVPENKALLNAACGRKIVLMKLHWPKSEGGKSYSPKLSVYADLIQYLPAFEDMFFAVMPHPNFFYKIEKSQPAMKYLAEEIRTVVENAPNAMLCTDSDYRPTIIRADCVITDRSALMVEASVLDVPIMYMTGKDWEPLNDAVAPIVLSYYQGQTCEDMLRFLAMYRRGQDPKRIERRAAVAEWIPYFDGKAGERIAEDLVEGVRRGK